MWRPLSSSGAGGGRLLDGKCTCVPVMVCIPSLAACLPYHGCRVRRASAAVPPSRSAGLRPVAAAGSAFRDLPAGLRRAVCRQVRRGTRARVTPDRRAEREGLPQVRLPARRLRPRPLPRLPPRDVRGVFLQAALHVPLLPPETGPDPEYRVPRPRSTWPKRSAGPSRTGRWC